jgi:hypothetical protein
MGIQNQSPWQFIEKLWLKDFFAAICRPANTMLDGDYYETLSLIGLKVTGQAVNDILVTGT